MGKGDKKSKKGKIFMGSFGNSRPKSAAKASGTTATAAPAPAPAAKEKKPAAKKATKKES